MTFMQMLISLVISGVKISDIYYKDSKVLKNFYFLFFFFYDEDKLSIGNITAYPRSVVKKIII